MTQTLSPAPTTSDQDLAARPAPARRTPRPWVPRHVLVTRSAAERPHTAEVLRRCEAAGVTDVRMLTSDRITGLSEGSEREVYARAKATMALVVAPPSVLKPQPIPPSADWRLDLARGCPAHCQYCYLAGSLSGPPITRVHANLEDVLAGIDTHVGRGGVTSGTDARGHEGTTFELSCYTDPLGLEHLTGSLGAAIARVGRGEHGDASLRFTTKYAGVDELLDLPHGGRTRMRASVNVDEVADRFEGGTAPVAARLAALRRMALAGYPVGLTVAPVMPVDGWQTSYAGLLDAAAAATADVPGLDLTVELITHRFTPASKEVLTGWYPRTRLEMDESQRAEKRTKFGGVKHVYPRETMAEMKAWFTDAVAERLPGAPLLYWT
ncbi:SPL family radical SAM protein [Nocardioides perillae]|uniref:Spore photoproduct lyase n=1 Tax=Nocardioides perillae TaxID=1119534 RepID=A0A7Y9RXH3_9ACTN|nr:radical SAM protein [Nocardioides perillae]NYG55760.1 spore photoproduct lyase [Nocardioides perillae]